MPGSCHPCSYTVSIDISMTCTLCLSLLQWFLSFQHLLPNWLTLSKNATRLTTVSKPTCRRFLQLIHVKGAAVLDLNVVFPSTTIVWPMIANFTSHFTVCQRRMFSFDPSRGMRTTTTHRWTWSGHLWVTSNTSKAIPARSYISLITSDLVLSSERFEAVGCIEVRVIAAWVKSCSSWWKNTIM